MHKSRTRVLGPALFGALLLAAVASPNAAIAESPNADKTDHPSYLIPTELPEGAIDGEPAPEYRTGSTVPMEVSEALVRLEFENPELDLSGTEWDSSTETVLLYSAAKQAHVERTLAEYGLDASVEYRQAQHSYAEMQEMIHTIIGDDGVLPSGHQVVTASPAIDGSKIGLVLDETSAQDRSTNAVPKFPDVDVPVTIDYGPPAVASLRNHGPTPYRYSGAWMHPSVGGCTTGFRVTNFNTSATGMVSANHCENTIGQQWYYATPTDYTIGQFQGTNPPPTMNGLPDLALWTGSGTGQMMPGMFIGTNTVSGSYVYAIKGVAGTTLGVSVCYSGSLSGTVCGNTVTEVNVTACYAGISCYDRLAVTQQGGGLPAVGQGDSGGPVYGTSGGGVYAAGIISGMRNATSTCTGDQGRLCSSWVLYAPLPDVFELGYGVNYVP